MQLAIASCISSQSPGDGCDCRCKRSVRIKTTDVLQLEFIIEVDFFKENDETRNGRQRVVEDEYKKKDYISNELPVHPLVSGSKATKPLNTLPDPTTLEYKDTGLRWSL
ncbi:hypothetical protein V6N13_067679 [Hibiscus sabdariffa]|uniref:Uncharacterized protein n=1 Tax=Hibiscus sabdariffa TaxID=183260 RepID=A0ABR2DU87_9ROSI